VDKIAIAMKISQVKEILNSIFEEDDSLKYALATNLAKYGRPQSKKSDKPSKLTKGLEKKREKNVKDLKKSMDEKVDLVHVTDKDGKMFGTGERVKDSNGTTTVRFDAETTKDFPTSQVKTVKEQDMGSPFPGEAPGKGYTTARDIIAMLREKVYPKLNDDELEEFGTEMHDHFIAYMKESISEGISELEKIADSLSSKFPDLRFDVSTTFDRIDVRGSRSDVIDFGEELQGEKIFDYEVFYIEEDPGERGAIVRIVKSDSISRGGVKEDKKKADRCLRIARRKIPQSSAYRSGLIVKCRKGMIWKSEK